MKKIFLVAILMLAANTSQAAMTASEKDDFCIAVKGLAEATMKNRLSGVDVADSMRVANNSSSGTRTLAREMTIKAYSSYGYKTDEYRESAIKDFGAEYYIECMTYAK